MVLLVLRRLAEGYQPMASLLSASGAHTGCYVLFLHRLEAAREDCLAFGLQSAEGSLRQLATGHQPSKSLLFASGLPAESGCLVGFVAGRGGLSPSQLVVCTLWQLAEGRQLGVPVCCLPLQQVLSASSAWT